MSIEAHRRAERYAPHPQWDPVHAGIAGGGTFGLAIAIFAGASGIDPSGFPLGLALTVAVGFLVPFGYLKHRQVTHLRAWAQELRTLEQAGRE